MASSILAPVGPWDDPKVSKKGGNRKADVKTVQKLLAAASSKLKKPAMHPGTPDGLISRTSSRSSTLKAISAFQKTFLSSPDQRVDVGGTTWKKLLKSSQAGASSGGTTISIDGKKLKDLMDAMMDGHCKYGFGDKARMTDKPADIKKIDCSGFVQYLLYHVATPSLKIRAGSWHQNKYFEDNHFEQVDYATEASKRDGILRLGYFRGSPGHIWLVLNGETIESSGGKGPNRRAWSTGVLKSKVQRCYVVGRVLSAASIPKSRASGRTMYA